MGNNEEKSTLMRQTSSSISNATVSTSMDIEAYSQHSFSSYDANRTETVQVQPYWKTYLPKELLCCIILCIFGVYSPAKLWRPMFGIHMRPIPYQKLSSGDVILDLALSNEYKSNDQVWCSSMLLKQTSFTLPLIIMVIVTQITPKARVKYHDTHAAACVLLTSIGACEFSTQMAKMFVGRLRPNFYQFCGFNAETLTCTGSEHDIIESRSSFPSGHSSLCTCGMFVLVLFFLGRAKIGSSAIPTKNGKNSLFMNRKIAAIVSITPLAWSTFVACSRLYDNWHHPSDIVAGCFMGLFFPAVAYHIWYPSVVSSQAGIPLESLIASTIPSNKDFA